MQKGHDGSVMMCTFLMGLCSDFGTMLIFSNFEKYTIITNNLAFESNIDLLIRYEGLRT